jgi:hypothetical protein
LQGEKEENSQVAFEDIEREIVNLEFSMNFVPLNFMF